MAWFLEVLILGLKGGIVSALKLALIIVPIMIFIELLKAFNVLEKLYFILGPLLKLLKLPKEAALPIMAGLVFGLIYGSGLIIQAAREGHLSNKDLLLINIFLGLCHSLIEDHMIFVALGANVFILLIVRLTVAILVTYLVGLYLARSKTNGLEAKKIDILQNDKI